LVALELLIAKHILIMGRIARAIPMKMIAEYLERALQFERMAAEEADALLKQQLLKQAADYRRLAEKRAALLAKLPSSEPPQSN
jgi:hypothetical protein